MSHEDRPIWLNGEIVKASEAKVSVLSPAAQFGVNVFEGIRCYQNSGSRKLFAFRLSDHLDRLWESCKLLGITPCYSQEVINDAIDSLVDLEFYGGDVSLRVNFFVHGEGSWQSSDPVGLFIAPISKPRNENPCDTPKTAGVSSWQRISDNALPPRVKCGANYINGRYAQREADAKGFDLPIFLDAKGYLSEGAGACIFLVKNGKLITPGLSCSILESITRDTIFCIADFLSIPVEVRNVNRTELYVADEVFFCGSAAELTAVSSVDGFELPRNSDITAALSNFYFACADGRQNFKPEWRTLMGSSDESN